MRDLGGGSNKLAGDSLSTWRRFWDRGSCGVSFGQTGAQQPRSLAPEGYGVRRE